MALHRWKKLWIIRHSRDQAFHLFLSWPSSHPLVQGLPHPACPCKPIGPRTPKSNPQGEAIHCLYLSRAKQLSVSSDHVCPPHFPHRHGNVKKPQKSNHSTASLVKAFQICVPSCEYLFWRQNMIRLSAVYRIVCASNAPQRQDTPPAASPFSSKSCALIRPSIDKKHSPFLSFWIREHF